MTLALMIKDQLKNDVTTISIIIIITTKTVTLLAGVTIDSRQERWEFMFCTFVGCPFILCGIYEVFVFLMKIKRIKKEHSIWKAFVMHTRDGTWVLHKNAEEDIRVRQDDDDDDEIGKKGTGFSIF